MNRMDGAAARLQHNLPCKSQLLKPLVHQFLLRLSRLSSSQSKSLHHRERISGIGSTKILRVRNCTDSLFMPAERHCLQIPNGGMPVLRAVFYQIFQKFAVHAQAVVEIGKYLTIPGCKYLVQIFLRNIQKLGKFLVFCQTVDLIRGIYRIFRCLPIRLSCFLHSFLRLPEGLGNHRRRLLFSRRGRGRGSLRSCAGLCLLFLFRSIHMQDAQLCPITQGPAHIRLRMFQGIRNPLHRNRFALVPKYKHIYLHIFPIGLGHIAVNKLIGYCRHRNTPPIPNTHPTPPHAMHLSFIIAHPTPKENRPYFPPCPMWILWTMWIKSGHTSLILPKIYVIFP